MCVCVCVWLPRMCVCVCVCVCPLKQQTATHSSILAWKILWTEEPGGLQSMLQRVKTRLSAHIHTHTHTHLYISESLYCTLETNTTL